MPPKTSSIKPSSISRALCSDGMRCIKPLAPSRNETNSSRDSGGADGAILAICSYGGWDQVMMWSHFVQNQADPLPFWFGFRFLDCRSGMHGSVDRQPISGAVPLFATKPVARPAALGKTYGLRLELSPAARKSAPMPTPPRRFCLRRNSQKKRPQCRGLRGRSNLEHSRGFRPEWTTRAEGAARYSLRRYFFLSPGGLSSL